MLPAMLSALLALVAAQPSPVDDPPRVFDGECIYPPGLGEPRPAEFRVTCSRVVMDADGVDFRNRAWDRSMLRFLGEWDGGRLTVRSVVPRSGRAIEVRGLCRVYYADEAVSVIACTAVSGGRSWIGNFKVSRL